MAILPRTIAAHPGRFLPLAIYDPLFKVTPVTIKQLWAYEVGRRKESHE
jgi:hypothetical protein